MRECYTPAFYRTRFGAVVDPPDCHMGIIQINTLLGFGPAQLQGHEFFAVFEKTVKCIIERIGGIGKRIGHTADEIYIIAQHTGRGDTERGVVRQKHAGRTGAESQILKPGPGRAAGKGIDIIRHIEKTADHGGPAFEKTLAPVKIGPAKALVAPGRADKPDITEIAKAEVAGRDIADSVPVFDFPHQCAGVFAAAPDEVPGAEKAAHAGRGIVFAKAVARTEIQSAVIDAE